MRWFSVMASLDLGAAISARACCRYLGGNRGVEPLQSREEPGPDQQLVPGIALAPAGRDVRP
jgi:hypothetical protein